MIEVNPNQTLYDPNVPGMSSNFVDANRMFMNQSGGGLDPRASQTGTQSSSLSRIPSLHLPAIILLAISWLLHTIATFIPYWATYSGVDGSRAGLWSARNFDYYSIQNFYFPQPTDFPTITGSIGFTSANTKGYVVTVQFLMTFNFVFMLIVLVLLTVDYIFAQRNPERSWSLLIRDYNTSDTALKYALLLYILYVFVIFEFAAWITYVGSRHDNNWTMHVSFAFAVIVSVFLIAIFIMYVLEFLKRCLKNRTKWLYWYGPYIEWGFFVYLSALLLLLLVICCPEWAYYKSDAYSIFAEIGLFKQCYLSEIYKKSVTSGYCTLSDTRSNQAWVNAAQAFMLMAYIFGIIILIIIVIFRKEFRHNARGYNTERVRQPTFTYIIAGLILFFCFIFTLIGISIFGGKVFRLSLDANWGYIVAVFAMVLFLITGILFILDAVHSERQANPADPSSNKSFFFPAPLNHRVLAMQPLLKPEPAWQQPATPSFPLMIPPFSYQQSPGMYPSGELVNPSFFSPQQTMMMPANYAMEPYPNAPITQALLTDYFRQVLNNPQVSSPTYNRGFMNYAGDNSLVVSDSRNEVVAVNYLNQMSRQYRLQQERLRYNHERLIEKYGRLRPPHTSEFRSLGLSSLPGRNYDDHLQQMHGNRLESSLVGQSRAGIGSSDETYRWMGEDSPEPLPRGVSSVIQHSRDDPMPSVHAERFELVQMYDHPLFGPTPAYIRPIFKKSKQRKSNKNDVRIKSSDRSGLSSKHSKAEHDHLVPIDPLLYNAYNQRSKGTIQSYGQSLYVPSGHHSQDRRPSYYEDILTSTLSEISSVLKDTPRKTSPPSEHRYNKLHSPPTSRSISQRLLQSSSIGHPSSSLLSNMFHAKNVSITSPKYTTSSTANSIVPYQTLSSIADNPSRITSLLKSKTISLNQEKHVPNQSAIDDIISSSSSDSDDDDEKKKHKRQIKK